MELKWPLLGLALGLGILLLVLWWSRAPRVSASSDALLVAHSQRLQRLPRFQALRRRELLVTSCRIVAVLVLLAGALLLTMRPQTVQVSTPEKRSRDIMLCLDASSSMSDENDEVIGEVRRIAESLKGERIGLTVFSGASVTIFPLTDDYEFVLHQLDLAEEAFEDNDYDFVAGVQLDDERGSQMGDGLVSCVQRFDRPDDERGRAVLIASDNDPQGPPVLTLAEAGAYAAKRNVVVYGIGSPDLSIYPDDEQEFSDAMAVTGGTYARLGEGESAGAIVEGINRLESKRLESPPEAKRLEAPRVGTVIAGTGLGLLIMSWGLDVVLWRRGRRA